MFTKVTTISLITVCVVIAILLVALFVNLGALFAPKESTHYQPNQILFIGPNYYTANVERNSSLVGNMVINVTQPGPLQFSLSDEKYYPPGSISNGSAYSNVSSITKGNVTFFDSATYPLVPVHECVAVSVSTATIGTSTVRLSVSCNGNDYPLVITTGPIRSSAGVFYVTYSLVVPENASLGTYMIDFTITSQSLVNMATMSGSATYVVTANVVG